MKKKIFSSLLVSLFIVLSLMLAVGSSVSISSTMNFYDDKNFNKIKINRILPDDEHFQSEESFNVIFDDLPPEWDWRNVDGNDWTTPIKNQFQEICGSCWAFGALAGLEAMIKIWANDSTLDVDLSEQYMLSCSPGDCGGWYWMQTLNWIRYNGAIPEDCLPYEADDTIPCDDKCPEWGELLIGIENYHKVTSNVSVIRSALFEFGPLPASMIVYEDFYPNYPGGVYQYSWGDIVFGHCITIVGYNNSWGGPDEGYWIVKNSWGSDWGEDGWFRIAYGECEMEKGVYYYTGPNYADDKPGTPYGPISGQPGEEYTYTSTAIDPDGDTIKYCFDWGDGNTSWSCYVNSGEPVSMNYSWEKEGIYEIKVKVRDEHFLDSPWSDPLPVEMPINTHLLIHSSSMNVFERYHLLFFSEFNIHR
jgi:C1A family cysteine protease